MHVINTETGKLIELPTKWSPQLKKQHGISQPTHWRLFNNPGYKGKYLKVTQSLIDQITALAERGNTDAK